MPTIVDVGARGGLHPRWQQSGFPVHGILFEPDPAAAEELRAEFARSNKEADKEANQKDAISVFETALSEKEETISLNVFRFGGASSVYPLNYAEAEKYYADTSKFEVVERVELNARRLDDVLAENAISHVDAVKIDTQGFELSVLRGSVQTLERAVCVEVEVEFRPIYENQPLFPEVNAFLSERGFELFDLGRCFRARNECRDFGDRRGQLVWGDGLYFKSPETFVRTPNLTDEHILGAFQTYLVYGYPDAAQVLLQLVSNQVAAATKAEMTQGLAGFRKQPFKRSPATRVKRLVRRLAEKVVSALAEEHPHAFRRDAELGNRSQQA